MNPVTVASTKIKKAQIAITVEGCVDCGNSTGSTAWYVAKEVPVKIGTREFTIVLHRCADCEVQRAPLFHQTKS